MPLVVIAHRTCPRDNPENSLAGIRLAATRADAVEIDVRLAADGVPVLLHDSLLLRTACRPWPIGWVSSERARRLRLRGTSEHLPLLAEALDALAPGLSVAIDVKDRRAGPAVVEAVGRRGLADRVLFWSQHEMIVRLGAESGQPFEVALLRDTFTPDQHRKLLDDAVAFGARAVSARWEAVTPEYLAEAHIRGLRVYSWCRQRDALAAKIDLLLDGVVTDWPQDIPNLLA